MKAKGETLFSSFLNLALAEVARQEKILDDGGGEPADLTLTDLMAIFSMPNRQDAIKYVLGQSLAVSGSGLTDLGPGTGITILDDRNNAALAVLRERLDDENLQSFSVFYGAAHMGGLERGLQDLGFRKVSQVWLTAWKTEAQVATYPDRSRSD